MALVAVIFALTVIFAAQNWQPVCLSLLGFVVQGPLFIALIAFFGLGLLSGWLWGRMSRKSKSIDQGDKQPPRADMH